MYCNIEATLKHEPRKRKLPLRFFAGLALWLLLLPKVQDNPFIYFRF